jgi:hypothetical protein
MRDSITQEDLDLHAKWLRGESDGVRYVSVIGKINVETDLRHADLSNADLRGADLRGTNLRGTNLRGTNLSDADLSNADLSGANLSNADLSGANLSNADLRGADLRHADLSNADLRGANLRHADLSGANIDFASWPLWCGGKEVKIDARIAEQLAGHCAVVFVDLDGLDDDTKVDVIAWQDACRKLGKRSHRAQDLGLME